MLRCEERPAVYIQSRLYLGINLLVFCEVGFKNLMDGVM